LAEFLRRSDESIEETAMQLKITDDKSYGPGCAWLEIFAAVPPDVAYRLSSSNSQKPHLGPHGWQSAPYEFQPRKVVSTPTGARLLVGPEIVDRMQEDMRIKLEIPETGYVAEAIWPDIPVSAVRDQATLDEPPAPHVLPPLPQRRQAKPREEPEATRPAQSEPSVAQELNGGSSASRLLGIGRVFRSREGTAAGLRFGHAMTPTTAILLASFAFLLFAGIGYAYVDSRRSSPAETPGPALVAQADEAKRLLVNGERQPEQLFSLGILLHRTPGAGRDLGLQAIQRAAEYDHIPALLWLGQTADPGRTEWQGVAREPNAVEALAAYAKAARLGNTQAHEYSTALCNRLRRQVTSAAEARARDNRC
jgi:hypothetical protein